MVSNLNLNLLLVSFALGLLLGVGLATGGGPIGTVDGADDGIGPGNAFERGARCGCR